ncbi:MAG: ABC transporter substrate-binding protein [Desulfurococcales archaeon]|nr:ABC transporter substrate-binding protein [Desulfurococcales archaeon]
MLTQRALSKTLAYTIIIIVIIGVIGGAYALTRGGGGGKKGLQATTTSPIPTYKKLVVGVVASKIVLDPAIADDYASWFILSKTMEGLVKINPRTGSIEPGLAVKWYSPDNGKTWIFILRKNLKFADGTPCTAKDVVRSIQRVMMLGGHYSWLVTSFVFDVRAINDTAVKIVLKTPVQDFPAFTSTPVYYVVSPSYPFQNPLPGATFGGVGPYKIKAVTINEVDLVVNNNYYGEKPHAQELIVKIYPSSKALAAALEKGEVDIAWWGLTPDDAQALKSKGYTILESDKSAVSILAINTETGKPTSNKLVREALAYALDQSALASQYDGDYDEPVLSVLPRSYVGYVDAFKAYAGLNQDKARSLLAKAGYNEGNKLHLVLITSTAIYGTGATELANLVKKQLEATGVITVEVKDLTHDAFYGALIQGDYDLALETIYPVYPDPVFYIILTLYSKANYNLGITYTNPQVDNSIERVLASVDYSLRQTIFEKLQQTALAGDIPAIPLVEYPTLAAVKPDVKGVTILPNMLLSTP